MQSAEAATPAPDVGDAGELEQALHGPVLSERPVEDREHDVDLAQRRGGCGVARRRGASPTLVSGISPRPLASSQRPARSISTTTVS